MKRNSFFSLCISVALCAVSTAGTYTNVEYTKISDQYGATNFNLKDGTVVSGRIMNLGEDRYQVNTDMMNPSATTSVNVNDLVSIEASPISMMPPGLINTMSEDDVLDLLAYFISGGDPTHPAFNDRDLRK